MANKQPTPSKLFFVDGASLKTTSRLPFRHSVDVSSQCRLSSIDLICSPKHLFCKSVKKDGGGLEWGEWERVCRKQPESYLHFMSSASYFTANLMHPHPPHRRKQPPTTFLLMLYVLSANHWLPAHPPTPRHARASLTVFYSDTLQTFSTINLFKKSSTTSLDHMIFRSLDTVEILSSRARIESAYNC